MKKEKMINSEEFKDLQYQLYKQARTIIDKAYSLKMTYEDFLFLHEIKNQCDNHDTQDRSFLSQWLSEQLCKKDLK